MKFITENTPLEEVKKALDEAGKRIPSDLYRRANQIRQIYASRMACDAYFTDQVRKDTALLIRELMQAIWDAKGDLRSKDARLGGEAKAMKLQPLKDQIREVWATGKFKTRDLCADQEWASIGFGSYKTARKALAKTPDPIDWAAKK